MKIRPDFAEAHHNRGNTLKELKRLEDALDSYDRALKIRPDYVEAWNNRGNALKELRRPSEALGSYDRALNIKPDAAAVHYNRGVALLELGQPEEALNSFDRALKIRPEYAEAHHNRGRALKELGRLDEALDSYDRALKIRPEYAEAACNRGNALHELKRLDEALESYDRASRIAPDLAFLHGALLHTKMKLCDWSDLDVRVPRLLAGIENGEDTAEPFPVIGLTDSSALLRKAAEIWVRDKYPANPALPHVTKRERHARPRVGYFSADLRNHVMASLITELFELHDKARFEFFAFSFGPDHNDQMRQRISAAFEHFVDVRRVSDRDVALQSRKLEIDIAVDLNGFTQNSRPGIFALRAAPLQVNYLGYPGTMGAEYIDYLIADGTLIPAARQQDYSEKIAYLPDSYQVNDRKRAIADQAFSREDWGLPRAGFVFCCFNNNYKITPGTFDGWMRILQQVDDSVLWLLEDNTTAARNLRKEASARGVRAERLIFAGRMPPPEHLARHRLADLFLDTLPYNAHTTASDALWAGLPVLTCMGEAFASRVAASLLKAIALPELITTTTAQYETLAVSLAASPQRLQDIRDRLERNRLTTPLFDTPRFTKHIEDAFLQMYERYQAGLPPDHIHVSP